MGQASPAPEPAVSPLAPEPASWWSSFVFSSVARRGVLAVALLLLVTGVRLLLVHTYGYELTAPFWDQWDAEALHLYPAWHEGTLGLSQLLERHNEHRILWSRLVFIWLLDGHGLWDPLLQMVFIAGLRGLFAVALFFMLCQAGGPLRRDGAWFALTLVLTGIPYDWENILCGFQNQFEFMHLSAVLAVWLMARARRPFGLRWWLGWLPLVLGLGTMAGGLFTAVALSGTFAVQGLLQPAGERRRAWQAAALLMVLALVALAFHLPTGSGGDGASRTAGAVLHGFFLYLSWPLGLGGTGWLLVYLPALVGAVQVWRRQLPFTPGLRVAAALTLLLLVHAAAIAWSRWEMVLTSRYLSLNALALAASVLWAVHLLHHAPPAARWARLSPGFWASAWLVAVVAALVGDWLSLRVPDMHAHLENREQHPGAIKRYYESGDDRGLMRGPRVPIPPHPDGNELKPLLAQPLIKDLLPSAVKPAPVPTVITPSDAFVSQGGLNPGTRPPPAERYWGSRPEPAGEAATGELVLEFEGSPATQWVEIWISGAPSPKGSSLVFQDTSGRRKIRLIPDGRPGHQWQRHFVKIPYRPYRLEAADRFEDRAFAFTQPVAVGHWEPAKRWLLEHALHLMATAGLLLAVGTLVQSLSGMDHRQKRLDGL